MIYPERISIITHLFKDNTFKTAMITNQYGCQSNVGNVVISQTAKTISKIVNNWIKNEHEVLNYWLKNPDLRLIQVLINLKIAKHFCHHYNEDDLWLMKRGFVDAKSILLFEVTKDEYNAYLPKSKIKLAKQLNSLEIEHLLQSHRRKQIKLTYQDVDTLSKCLELLNQKT
jgi:hypothetical protein